MAPGWLPTAATRTSVGPGTVFTAEVTRVKIVASMTRYACPALLAARSAWRDRVEKHLEPFGGRCESWSIASFTRGFAMAQGDMP
jgi:hypothetical protein